VTPFRKKVTPFRKKSDSSVHRYQNVFALPKKPTGNFHHDLEVPFNGLQPIVEEVKRNVIKKGCRQSILEEEASMGAGGVGPVTI